jgi:hypothetical protein
VQEPAAVVAQVQHHPAQPLGARPQRRVDGLAQRRRGVVREGVEAHVEHPVGQQQRGDGVHLHVPPAQLHAHVGGLALTPQRHAHQRAHLAAHQPDGVGQAHVARVPPLDHQEAVPGQEARALGRALGQHAQHDEPAVAHAHLHADAGEAPLGVVAQHGELLGVQIRGVRIEAAQHAADGPLDQALAVHGLHVADLHVSQRASEDAQVGEGARLASVC